VNIVRPVGVSWMAVMARLLHVEICRIVGQSGLYLTVPAFVHHSRNTAGGTSMSGMETTPQPAVGPSYPPPYTPPPYGAAPMRQRTPLRDVVLGWRAVLAVLLAGLIVGGLAGAGLMAIIDHHGGQQVQRVPQGSFGDRGGFGQSF
jgi:hypothetical protein